MSELPIDLPRSRRLRFPAGVFDTRGNVLISLAFLAIGIRLVLPLWNWAVRDAVWSGSASDCNSDGAGACWAFIATKFRFIIFGFYPPDLQWRPAIVLAGIALLLFVSTRPRLWTPKLLFVWFVAIVFFWSFMAGAIISPAIATNQWGGVPLTILVSLTGLALAFPVAILLALARRSSMVIVRLLSILFIEGVRGVPLIAVLYVAMLIVPMALPEGVSLDKLLRAQIGLTFFFAAYFAEIIRAGLQAIPAGQDEAASALGFRYWRTMQLVVLPQALRHVVPAIVNLAIGIVLNTSLLVVIGISDLLNTAKMAATDANWLGFYTEAFLFAAIIYFAICYAASRYSRRLERRLDASR